LSAPQHYHLLTANTALHNSTGGFQIAMSESPAELGQVIADDVAVWFKPRPDWRSATVESRTKYLPVQMTYTATIFPCAEECDAWKRHERALARTQESPKP
jgi:hypothetical protein